MHDAGLNDGFGEDRVDRIREALQAVDNGDQDIGYAPVFQLDTRNNCDLDGVMSGVSGGGMSGDIRVG